MKIGKVTPLLKTPGLDTIDFLNLRPIMNLSTVSKLLERLVLQRLRSQFESSLNYCELQSAYRDGRFTETAIDPTNLTTHGALKTLFTYLLT